MVSKIIYKNFSRSMIITISKTNIVAENSLGSDVVDKNDKKSGQVAYNCVSKDINAVY